MPSPGSVLVRMYWPHCGHWVLAGRGPSLRSPSSMLSGMVCTTVRPPPYHLNVSKTLQSVTNCAISC